MAEKSEELLKRPLYGRFQTALTLAKTTLINVSSFRPSTRAPHYTSIEKGVFDGGAITHRSKGRST